MQIGLTYDLRDTYRDLGYSEEAVAEFDSAETIEAIESALRAMGHQVERIGNIWQLTEALAAGKRWELVFNIAEGLHGVAREAQVPGLLEAYGVPYTFSPPEALVVAHDKSLAKLIVAQAGLATARWQVVREAAEIDGIALPYPLFVKPLAEGTGKGVSARSVAESPQALRLAVAELLRRFHQPVLVETYLPGREFTVGLLGDGGETQAVGALEVTLLPGAEAGGHTYHNKEHCEALMTYALAADDTAQRTVALAVEAWKTLGCRDAGRVDIRCDAAGNPHFLEVNPLAGLHPTHSDLCILASKAGMSYCDLMERIMDRVTRRLAGSASSGLRCAS